MKHFRFLSIFSEFMHIIIIIKKCSSEITNTNKYTGNVKIWNIYSIQYLYSLKTWYIQCMSNMAIIIKN